jgi:gamma-glutamylcyclotransferase (GGCT)/AIG2-like uncharacterized protein YtfP
MNKECLLFVYGTLMKKCSPNKYSIYLQNNAKYIGEYWAKGILYQIDYYPGLVDGNDKVFGELYHLVNPEVAFSVLDNYEGFNPLDIASSLFIRKDIQLHSSLVNESFTAQTYFYNQSFANLDIIANGWFQIL